jgi:hypothetical protein
MQQAPFLLLLLPPPKPPQRSMQEKERKRKRERERERERHLLAKRPPRSQSSRLARLCTAASTTPPNTRLG